MYHSIFHDTSAKRLNGGNEGGSEFSSYKIELRNRVTQNDVTLPVTNSKIFTEILPSSYLLDFVKH